MELLLNDEQRLLQESAAKLCRDLGGCGRVRALRNAGAALDRPALEQVSAAGWLALLPSETAGGLGLGAFELALISQEVGRQLLRVPVAPLACAVWALSETGRDVGDEMAGKRLVVPALGGAATPFAVEGSLPLASRGGESVRLEGIHVAVAALDSAQTFLVSATDGNGSPLLCLVPATEPGAIRRPARLLDGSDAGELLLNDAPARVLARGPDATRLITAMRARLLIANAAEMLGLGEAALDLALAHLKLRHQFGRPIGSFQALQHRTVDGFVGLEMLKALVYRIAADVDAGRAHPAMLPALKAKAGSSGLAVVRTALQVHGAMGYTDEHDIGLLFKHAIVLDAHLGNEMAQLSEFARLSVAVAAAGP